VTRHTNAAATLAQAVSMAQSSDLARALSSLMMVTAQPEPTIS